MDQLEQLKAKVAEHPNSTLFVRLAEEYMKLGELDDAYEVVRAGIKRQPSYITARVTLGKLFLKKGMLPEAVIEFERVVEAIPDNLFAHRRLADTYRDLGLRGKAIEQYEEVLQLNPMDDEAERILADLRSGKPMSTPHAEEAPAAKSPAPQPAPKPAKQALPQAAPKPAPKAAQPKTVEFMEPSAVMMEGSEPTEADLEDAAYDEGYEVGDMEIEPDGIDDEEGEYRDDEGIEIGGAHAAEPMDMDDAYGEGVEVGEIDIDGDLAGVEASGAEETGVVDDEAEHALAAELYGEAEEEVAEAEPAAVAEPEDEVLAVAEEEPETVAVAEPEPASKPAPKPALKPMVKPAPKPAAKPVSKQPVKPAPKSAPRGPGHGEALTEGELAALRKADDLISEGEYVKAMNLYTALLTDGSGNETILMKVEELKLLLKVMGLGGQIYKYKLQTFLGAIKRRRDEFFANS